MLEPVCPTCGTILATRQLPYEREMHRISGLDSSDEEKDQLKMALLDTLKLHRYCCRMRMITYTRLIDIIR